MLQDVTFEHFQSLLGNTCQLQMSDGSQLPVHVASVAEKPQARAARQQRMPFNVLLESLEPSEFVDGACAIELPELGLLQNVFVSRVPAMGRDENLAYYCISFN
ncbi:hypothetical protein YA0032_11140 [Pseudomonas amygdali]|uniref:DUF6916 family protein n=1 Tax=Pseudomonas amygdali TaxID=47877 RepID=UPI0018E5F916|nr:hypothetical protein [Pseudomonas amygdali]MBI6730220.1 hypothetical protein [Pseudomonas amygdali]MBI6811731.1 hypothetical protein [Pseudomonas amygdali]